MRTVYAIAEVRTIKHITGARAGQISHTFGFKKHWDETLKKSIEYFPSYESASVYVQQQRNGYMHMKSNDGYEWKVVTPEHSVETPGSFTVQIEWGKSTKHITMDSISIVPLVIED